MNFKRFSSKIHKIGVLLLPLTYSTIYTIIRINTIDNMLYIHIVL